MTTSSDPCEPLPADNLPPGWANPRPQRSYDLAVIGGTRLSVAAAMAAVERGARVALVARDLRYEDNAIRWLGGSSGCPSNPAAEPDSNGRSPRSTASAFAAASALWRRQLGLELPLWELLGYGVDVFFGPARFVGPRALAIDDVRLQFSRAVLAVGPGCPPPEPSMAATRYLSPAGLSRIESPPRRLLIVGDGSEACEMAQAFCRLNCEVHLAAGMGGILPQADARAAEWLLDRLMAEGVRIYRGWKIATSSRSGRWQSIVLERHDQRQELIAEQIVEARDSPLSLAGLDPVAAGIRSGARGVAINSRLQTSNRAIVAVGHAAGQQFLAGAATAAARLAVGNALGRRQTALDPLLLGQATDTDPQVAHVGLTLSQADALQLPVESHWVELGAALGRDDDDSAGLAVMHLAPASGRLLGLSIAGRGAALLAAEVAARLRGKGRLDSLADAPSLSAEHEHALRQIMAACRGARV